MVDRTLRLTRAQIRNIVGDDPDAIRQFERLFAVADTVPASTDVALSLAEFAATAPVSLPSEAMPVETLDWRTFPRFVPQQGRMGWEPFYGTLGLGMNGNTIHRLGLNSFVRVTNSTGSILARGTVVGIGGIADGYPDAVAFLADGAMPASTVLGMVAGDIASGAQGYACSYGPVINLDTSAYSLGDTLYASATVAGAWQATPGALAVPLGEVAAVNATAGVVIARVHQMGPAELATVAAPAGGGTVDAEARTAINDIIARLQQAGIIG